MSKFNIPKIVRPLELAAYAPELAAEIGAAPSPIQMWINPPRCLLERFVDLQAQIRTTAEQISKAIEKKKQVDQQQIKVLADGMAGLGDGMAAWWSEVWSQGDADRHWTKDQVREFQLRCMNEDPALWDFIVEGCWQLVREHRERARKN